MGKAKKLGKDFGLLTIGSFASKVLTFLLVPLYTAVLTTKEYGQIDIINTTVNLLFPIAVLVISESVIRFSLDGKTDKKQVWTIGILITAIGCGIVLVLSPIILFTSLRQYYWFFLFQLVSISFHTTIAQFVKGLNKVGIYAIGGIINTFIVVMMNVLLLLIFHMGLTGYMIALITGHTITILYFVLVLKLWKYFISYRSIDKNILKAMLQYSVPMIPNSISWWISDSSDKYVVQLFCGYAVNGVYAAAYKIPALLQTISTLFINAWQISAFEDFESEETKRFFSIVANEYIRLNIVIASILILCTKPIAMIMFKGGFFEAWRLSPVLILAYVFYTASSFWGTVYTAAKHTKMLFISTIIAAIGNIILNFLLTPRIGAIGAAIATLISYFTVFIIRVVHSNSVLKLKVQWHTISFSFLLIMGQIVSLSFDSLYGHCICGMLFMMIIIVNKSLIKKIVYLVTRKCLMNKKE